jgi:hypothetical protein
MAELRSLHQDAPADWNTISPSANLPGYAVYGREIKKPEVDDRDYRCIKLENGLEVLLVHDANTDKSAASLDVEVGHLHDPVSQFLLASRPQGLTINCAGRPSRPCTLLRTSVVHGMTW